MRRRTPRGGVVLWAMIGVMSVFLPATYLTVRQLEGIGKKRDAAVSILRARRQLALDLARLTERAPGEPLEPADATDLLGQLEALIRLGNNEPGQAQAMEGLREAIQSATETSRASALASAQAAFDAVYERDQVIVDAYRAQFSRVGLRGPYLLLALEAISTAGLVIAAMLVTREFRRRDETEAELRTSREKLASAERLARLGHWELDWASKGVAWSESLHEIMGVPREYFDGTLEGALVHVHAEDRVRVRESIMELASNPRAAFDQFRVVVNGETRVVFQRGTPVLDEAGGLVTVFGTAQDVTDQIRAEQTIRASEARFKTLCDYSPLVVYQSRADGTITYISPRWTTVSGVDPENSMGWTWSSSIHPEDRERVVGSWREATERSEPWTSEHRILRPDGQVRWVRVLASPIGDDRGVSTGYVGTAEDVTERIIAERMMAASRARFEAVIRASRQMLYDWNTVTNKVSVDGQEGVLGVSAASLETLGAWVESIHPDDRAEFDAEIHRVLATRQPFNLEYRLRNARGGYIPVHGRGYFLEGTDGDLHMLGLIADLSDRKALEGQLLHAQKMESIGSLAGGIAHDFNNWLTAIIGNVELARGAPLDPAVADALNRISAAADSAAGLTRQLVAFARRQVIEPVVCDPMALMDRARELLDRLLGENVSLSVHARSAVLWKVRVDPAQIQQVLVNLAVNARDAMPTGGRLTIEVSNVTIGPDAACEHAELIPGDFVQIAVSDTGTGISPAELPRIFEPFFTTKEQGRGTGLGLSTVQGIVKQSGGHIWVYSEPGLGTTFKLYFPRAKGQPETEREAGSRDVSGPKPLRAAKPGETVLVVEDQHLVRDLVCDVLTRRGYTVLAASDGPPAERIASSHPGPIHLLLTDLVLPSTDGRRLAASITAARPETRVLLTSGYTDLRAGLEPGVNYLAKPFGPDALASAVRDVLDRVSDAGAYPGVRGADM